MLLRLATVVLCLSAVSSGLPAAVKPRDVVLREATPEPEHMSAMSESLDYVKPREAKAKAEPEPEHMNAMSESLDYVKPREAKANAEPEPETMAAMSESLDYVKPREAKANAEPEPEHVSHVRVTRLRQGRILSRQCIAQQDGIVTASER